MKRYLRDSECLVMSRDEVRAFDSWAINELGVPGVVLMENAGRSCAELIEEKLARVEHAKVCIFCGTGNNGGDGFVIARQLLNSGLKVVTVLCGERSKVKGDAKVNLDILEGLGASIEQLDMSGGEDIEENVSEFATGCAMVVDGLFGTGFRGELRDEYKRLIESMNRQSCPIFSVDIPSGLDCDTGEELGAAIKASWTVTFAAVKRGFVREGAQRFTGEVYVASIGVEPHYRGAV